MKQTHKSTFSTMELMSRAISWKKVNPSTHTSINQFNCIALTLYNMKIAKDPILDLLFPRILLYNSIQLLIRRLPKCMNEKYKLIWGFCIMKQELTASLQWTLYMISTMAAHLFHHKGLEFGSCKIVQKEETQVSSHFW